MEYCVLWQILAPQHERNGKAGQAQLLGYTFVAMNTRKWILPLVKLSLRKTFFFQTHLHICHFYSRNEGQLRQEGKECESGLGWTIFHINETFYTLNSENGNAMCIRLVNCQERHAAFRSSPYHSQLNPPELVCEVPMKNRLQSKRYGKLNRRFC
jgi:hypothetical protein